MKRSLLFMLWCIGLVGCNSKLSNSFEVGDKVIYYGQKGVIVNKIHQPERYLYSIKLSDDVVGFDEESREKAPTIKKVK